MSEPEFRNEDARDEQVKGPDAGPIDEEAMAAAEGLEVRPGVKEHYQEMTERGANQRGEGRVP